MKTLVNIVGIMSLGTSSNWKLEFRQFDSSTVVNNAFKKMHFCLADIERVAKSTINLVNDGAGNVLSVIHK